MATHLGPLQKESGTDLALHEESLEWEALGKILGEWLWDSQALDI